MAALDCREETLNSLHPERYSGTLLLGDFNFDFGPNVPQNNYHHKLIAISDFFGLNQLVTNYTRTPENGTPTLLDHVYSTSAEQIHEVQVTEKLATSDHHMVTFKS